MAQVGLVTQRPGQPSWTIPSSPCPRTPHAAPVGFLLLAGSLLSPATDSTLRSLKPEGAGAGSLFPPQLRILLRRASGAALTAFTLQGKEQRQGEGLLVLTLARRCL